MRERRNVRGVNVSVLGRTDPEVVESEENISSLERPAPESRPLSDTDLIFGIYFWVMFVHWRWR